MSPETISKNCVNLVLRVLLHRPHLDVATVITRPQGIQQRARRIQRRETGNTELNRRLADQRTVLAGGGFVGRCIDDQRQLFAFGQFQNFLAGFFVDLFDALVGDAVFGQIF